MGKYNKKLLLCLGLFGLLSVTACGPTSDPTSNPTTNPTTTTSPTTTVPTTTTSDQPTTPDKGVLEGEVPAGHIYNVGDQFYDFSLTSTGFLKTSTVLIKTNFFRHPRIKNCAPISISCQLKGCTALNCINKSRALVIGPETIVGKKLTYNATIATSFSAAIFFLCTSKT